MSFYEDIAEFHYEFQLQYEGKPRTLNPRLHQFRATFMAEELHEYNLAYIEVLEAKHSGDRAAMNAALEKQLDALVDMTYVVLGTAHLHGFDFVEAWNRVHNANMMKQRVQRLSDSKRGSSYDVIKPDGWKAPDLSDLVT